MAQFLELSLIKGIIGLHQQEKQQLTILIQPFAYVSISIAARHLRANAIIPGDQIIASILIQN